MRAYYVTIRENGVYKMTCTVKPGQSASRRAILERYGLPLKGHTVEVTPV